MSKHTGYEITRDGKVFSVLHNWRGYGRRELAQKPNNHGYLSVRMVLDGKRKYFMVHKLVAEYYLPPRPTPAHELRHFDGVRTNNQDINLCWGTRKENADDREKHGRTSRGLRHSEAIKRGIYANR